MHAFVDESKAGPYLLVASVVLPSDVSAARGAVRALHLGKQSRLHMTAESDSRRRAILSALERAGLRATVYRSSGHRTNWVARAACIDALIRPLAVEPTVRVTFECDESQDERDRKQLYRLVRELGCTERVQYEHRRATAEPLLAVPDAIGWAYARGGDFRQRAMALIVDVVDV